MRLAAGLRCRPACKLCCAAAMPRVRARPGLELRLLGRLVMLIYLPINLPAATACQHHGSMRWLAGSALLELALAAGRGLPHAPSPIHPGLLALPASCVRHHKTSPLLCCHS